MNLLQRIGYFSVGLIMGIVILMFFLGGKRTSCDYSPNARVLKNIRIKNPPLSEEAKLFFTSNKIDTSEVNEILNSGSVDFGKSKTDNNEPCNIYFISGDEGIKTLELQIENCDSTATIQNAQFISN